MGIYRVISESGYKSKNSLSSFYSLKWQVFDIHHLETNPTNRSLTWNLLF